ncbi:MAG: hypothetical protein WAW53_14290 [Candidatus Dormiibacterota bacterium]
MDGAAARPVVALFGAFDTGDLGEVALRRVLEAELSRRRPDIDLIVLAPFGAEHPIPGDEGRPAQPLGAVEGGGWPAFDALVISGDVLGDGEHWAARYPAAEDEMATRGVVALSLTGARGGHGAALSVTWFAVGTAGGEADVSGLVGKGVWARDAATRQMLGGTAVQSGDPLLLAARVLSADALRRRADLLRMCGALPAGRSVVIEVATGFAASPPGQQLVEAVAEALRDDPKLSVVVATLNPIGQLSLASVLRVPGLVAERVHRLPDWVGLDDVAAAMSGSIAVLAITPAFAHLAASLRVPVAAVDNGIGDRFDPAIPVLTAVAPETLQTLIAGAHPAAIDTAIETLDGAFAELAQRLPRTASPATTPFDEDPVSSALAILQRRLVDERTALQAELSRVQAELDHLRASPEHRIARPIREGYQRWQRRRT